MANINKELKTIKNGVYGYEVRDSIHDGIDKVNRESEGSRDIASLTSNKQDALQTQFDNQIANIESDNPSFEELVQARNGYPLLKDRLESMDKLDEIEVDNNFKASLIRSKAKKGAIVWQDDDGHAGVYSKLAPFAREKGIVFSSAIITDRGHGFPIGGLPSHSSTYIKYELMMELHNEGLVEFIPHTHTHNIDYRLTDMSTSELHEELSTNKKIMRELGFNHTHLVYPFGSHNAKVREVARQYFESGFSTRKSVLETPLNQFIIPRVSADSTSEKMEELKGYIDEASEKNTLLCLITHVDQFGGLDLELFGELVDYALSKGLEFIKTSEAINEFGNLMQLNENTTISHDGKIHSNDVGVYKEGHFFYENNADIDLFERGTTTRTNVRIADYRDYGIKRSYFKDAPYGYIHTYRDSKEDVYSHQKFEDVISGSVLRRNWDLKGQEWGDWKFINGFSHINEIPSNPKFSDFEVNKVTTLKVRAIDSLYYDLGDSEAGSVKTYRFNEDEYTHQIFTPISNKYIKIRYAETSSGLWGNWITWKSSGSYQKDNENGNPTTSIKNFNEGLNHDVVTTPDARGYHASGDLPTDRGGVLLTHKVIWGTEYSWSWQEYHVNGAFNTETYKRNFKSDGSVNDWVKVTQV